MKALELIKSLADHVANFGDVEVFIPSISDAGHQSALTAVRGLRLLKVQGKQRSYLEADAKARALGYDLASAKPGVTLV